MGLGCRKPKLSPKHSPPSMKPVLKLNKTLQRLGERERRKKKKKKMIYRKWSLLTGPVAVLGGVVATVVVAHFVFVGNDRFLKPDPRKAEAATSRN